MPLHWLWEINASGCRASTRGPPLCWPPFENWLRAQGALSCEPDGQTGRYRCFTSGGVDVAEAAILNGAGRGRRRDTGVSRTGIRGAGKGAAGSGKVHNHRREATMRKWLRAAMCIGALATGSGDRVAP